jgi:hypothetical protein
MAERSGPGSCTSGRMRSPPERSLPRGLVFQGSRLTRNVHGFTRLTPALRTAAGGREASTRSTRRTRRKAKGDGLSASHSPWVVSDSRPKETWPRFACHRPGPVTGNGPGGPPCDRGEGRRVAGADVSVCSVVHSFFSSPSTPMAPRMEPGGWLRPRPRSPSVDRISLRVSRPTGMLDIALECGCRSQCG